MHIVIDPGSPSQREETRTIVAFGSLVLDRPLTHPHPANTPVHTFVPLTGSGAIAGKHQWPLYDPSVTYPLIPSSRTSSHTLNQLNQHVIPSYSLILHPSYSLSGPFGCCFPPRPWR